LRGALVAHESHATADLKNANALLDQLSAWLSVQK
jgi:hypothetical protein